MGAGDDLLLVEVVDRRDAEVLGEQALLRRHVHDQVVRGETVGRDDVEGVVGKLVDGAIQALRDRHVDVDHGIGRALPAGHRQP